MSTEKKNIIEIEVIARIQTDFPSKFGIPRQSGLVKHLEGRIVFEPEYRSEAAVKGIEHYSHLWLIWQFSENTEKGWSPTVRPPRLGGNTRMGVFATRSPFRPNHLGLSSVKLERVEMDEKLGPVLYVRGADLMDNTPIFDIKPYIPYGDSHPDATSGIFEEVEKVRLLVDIPEALVDRIPSDKLETLKEVLAEDPRPSYQKDPDRIYGLSFAGKNIRFRVEERRLLVVEVEDL
ncbi:tRNA (N6-threonylcarbamoyladenosine(37)-N6)-methyltransferase TrmO [Proteiniclasticum sp. C24MP]|uniref:tRNA (N6-threonylcarbamoyladenosine(37)-N6)-methyltransferase TrmO n=1 Tax=Proteiniclasticum sp. C24MP TaxID=3374101 RepID=UPI0037541F94